MNYNKYGDLLRKSPYRVRIQENMDQKKLRIWTLFKQCQTSNHRETSQLICKPNQLTDFLYGVNFGV